MSFEYITSTYGVPACIGRKVTFKGQPGVITGAHNQYIKVCLDGDKKSGIYHPTWEMTYGDIMEAREPK